MILIAPLITLVVIPKYQNTAQFIYRAENNGDISVSLLNKQDKSVPLPDLTVHAGARRMALLALPERRLLFAYTGVDKDQDTRIEDTDIPVEVTRHTTECRVYAVGRDGHLQLKQSFTAPYLMGRGQFAPGRRRLYFALYSEKQAIYTVDKNGLLHFSTLTNAGGGIAALHASTWVMPQILTTFAPDGKTASVYHSVQTNSYANYSQQRYRILPNGQFVPDGEPAFPGVNQLTLDEWDAKPTEQTEVRIPVNTSEEK